MTNSQLLKNYFDRLSDAVKNFNLKSIEEVSDAFMQCYQKGGTVYIFGNGGSGANASHICGDFIKGVSYGLEKRFKMICLNDNNSSMMAIANDTSYDEIFVEQLKNFAGKDDLVIGISGSGNSSNVVKAMEYAKAKGIKSIAMCGYKGGKIKDIADIICHIEVMDMEITEDAHLIVFHAIKQQLMHNLRGGNTSMGSTYDKRIN